MAEVSVEIFKLTSHDIHYLYINPLQGVAKYPIPDIARAMAIISEVKQEGAKPSASSPPSRKPALFNASFDSSNTIGFLEKVFDFVAEESDFLGKQNMDSEVAAVVRVAKEKYCKKKIEAEEKKKKEKEKMKKEAVKEPTKAHGKDKQTNPNLRGSYFYIFFRTEIILFY
ncbi:protein BOBBER 1-like [Hibiscus syriacus]|uniref:protein BOBBER 1-like n=1 Tax=Hibiscus syriacus TaxID=106335 RepID=UPI0019246992|nr:protein BOBBER 1-like [Hibiscus syriacus]